MNTDKQEVDTSGSNVLVRQKTHDPKNNFLIGIIPACGQPNDMFYSHHNCLLPIGNNITAIERCINECMSIGCDSIWINCHPSVINILKSYFGNYFKNPNWNTQIRFTDYPPVAKYIPIYYLTPAWNDFNIRTSWVYSSLYAAKTASLILSQLLETTKNVKYYFSFPTAVLKYSNTKAIAKLARESKNFCFEFEGKTFKDNLYSSFTLNKVQIYDALDKISYLETEYTDFGFNSRFFPISKIFKHLNIEKFEKLPLNAYYSIYTNKKYFDYLQKGDYCNIKKKSKLVRTYLNWKIPKFKEGKDEN